MWNCAAAPPPVPRNHCCRSCCLYSHSVEPATRCSDAAGMRGRGQQRQKQIAVCAEMRQHQSSCAQQRRAPQSRVKTRSRTLQNRTEQNRTEQNRTEQSRHRIQHDTTRHHTMRAPTGDVQRNERAVVPQCSGEGLTRRRPHAIVCAIASDCTSSQHDSQCRVNTASVRGCAHARCWRQ